MTPDAAKEKGLGREQRMGIIEKFQVTRLDGSSAYGHKHARCRYFVLDLKHDKFAGPALLAYAKACAKEYPVLARQLRKKGRP